jgi:hypothetical protein
MPGGDHRGCRVKGPISTKSQSAVDTESCQLGNRATSGVIIAGLQAAMARDPKSRQNQVLGRLSAQEVLTTTS